jgi:hypothetical protein
MPNQLPCIRHGDVVIVVILIQLPDIVQQDAGDEKVSIDLRIKSKQRLSED